MNFDIEDIFIQESSKHHKEILDADWNEIFGLFIALLDNQKVRYYVNGVELLFLTKIHYPKVRWTIEGNLVIVDSRTQKNKDNMFVINTVGELLGSFNCGDAVEDVVVNSMGIWVSYFDEGVFGKGISTEGVVLFDILGNVKLRFHTDFNYEVSIVDCYAMCCGKSGSVWIFPYTEFPLVNIDAKNRKLSSINAPKILARANAITYNYPYVYFYKDNRKIYRWDLHRKIEEVSLPHEGEVRGLKGKNAGFILISDKHVRKITFK